MSNDDCLIAGFKVWRQGSLFWKPIVPAYEISCRVYARQVVFTFYTKFLVFCSSVSEQNGVVVVFQQSQRQTIAYIDIANEIEIWRRCDFFKFILAVLISDVNIKIHGMGLTKY